MRRLVAARSRFSETRRHLIAIEHQSRYVNVYHCAVQKTGSQWLMSILSDVAVFRFADLSHYHFQTRARTDGRALSVAQARELAFPARSIISPLLLPYGVFAAIPKPRPWRAFYVLRDPREIVVSWYFSARRTHLSDGREGSVLNAARLRLASMTQDEGLCFAIDFLAERGRFAALLGWVRSAPFEPDLLLVRYEDLIGATSRAEFRRVFDFCDIRIRDPELDALLAAYSFARLTGRAAGSEDTASHLRSGAAATWRNHFSPTVTEHFQQRTGTLVADLGY